MPISENQTPNNTTKCDNGDVTNADFYKAIFHTIDGFARPWFVSFADPPDQVKPWKWKGRPLTARLLNGTSLSNPANNNFYCVSSFHQDAKGELHRRQGQHDATHVITMDDLGDGLSAKIPMERVALEPSFIIETSPGNCQAGYILRKPVTDADYINRTVDALVAQGLASPADPGMKGVTRLVRLPVGTNNKTKYDPPHRHVLKSWQAQLHYTLEDIIEAYGLDLSPAKPERHYAPSTMTAGDDPYLKALAENGHVLTGEVRGENMIDILCPFHEEHTDRTDEGAVYFVGSAGFKCWHGHCLGRTSYEYKKKLADDYWIDLDELDHILRSARVAPLFEEPADE